MKFKEFTSMETNLITRGFRTAFTRSERYKNILYKARVEQPKYLASGKLSRVLAIYYKCATCKKLYKRLDVQVDHIIPIIPLNSSLKELSFDIFATRLFQSELQILCKVCHKKKSKEENVIRRKTYLPK